jgi:palmitoyltransferase ZDHHC13/17
MGGRGGQSLSGQMGHRHTHGLGLGGQESPSPDLPAGGGGATAVHAHAHGRICAGCGSGFLMNLLGLDRFTKGRAVDGLARASKAPNPFDLGVVGNCKDFWTAGKELGVEYERLYDVPLEGFREAKRRREEDEDGGVGTRKGPRKGLFMGLGFGAGSSRAGYEPVSQV